MTCKRADVSKVSEGGHDEIRPVYREEFANRGMSHDFAERAWHLLLKKGEDYTEYPAWEEQERVRVIKIVYRPPMEVKGI